MAESVKWEQTVLEFIQNYETSGVFDTYQLEELLMDSSTVLYDPLLIHRLHDINSVSRWKHSIESKLEEGVLAGAFDEQDLVDIAAMQM